MPLYIYKMRPVWSVGGTFGIVYILVQVDLSWQGAVGVYLINQLKHMCGIIEVHLLDLSSHCLFL